MFLSSCFPVDKYWHLKITMLLKQRRPKKMKKKQPLKKAQSPKNNFLNFYFILNECKTHNTVIINALLFLFLIQMNAVLFYIYQISRRLRYCFNEVALHKSNTIISLLLNWHENRTPPPIEHHRLKHRNSDRMDSDYQHCIPFFFILFGQSSVAHAISHSYAYQQIHIIHSTFCKKKWVILWLSFKALLTVIKTKCTIHDYVRNQKKILRLTKHNASSYVQSNLNE